MMRTREAIPARPEPIRSSATVRAWLFVRGAETIRIVIDGTSVTVNGPGPRLDPRIFDDEMDATLFQAELERALVQDGWTLEELTTERRSPQPDVPTSRPHERRLSTLRLVPHPDESLS
jgi:hypothetical protein